VWGVHSIATKERERHRRHGLAGCEVLRLGGFSKRGDRTIWWPACPSGTPSATDMVRIAYVGREDVRVA
jgi:pyruvate kinase